MLQPGIELAGPDEATQSPNRLSPAPTPADFQALETLRGIAAAYVVLNHSRGWLWCGGEFLQGSSISNLDRVGMALNQFTRLGHEAVILFFVLSGFSIAHSVERSRSVPRFWWRRLVRLYPPKAAALLWAALVFYFTTRLVPDFYSGAYPFPPFVQLRESVDFLSARIVAGNLLYMPHGAPISQYWSLPHEMVFYFMAPLLIRRRREFYVVACLGWLVGAIGGFHGFWSEYFLRYLFYFAVGVATYRAQGDLRQRIDRVSGLHLGVFFVSAFLIVLGLSYPFAQGRAGEIVVVGAAVVAIFVCMNAQGGHPILRWLGRQSYTLYLTHVATILLLLALVHRVGATIPIRSPFLWLLALPPTLVVSMFFDKLVEERTRRWLDRSRMSPSAPPRSELPAGDVSSSR